jgi:hypothetical protein
MASTHQVASYKWLKPLRIMRVRWRLFFAAGVGLFAFAMMPNDLELISRVLIGWDIGVALYLALSIWTAIGADTKHIRLRCVLTWPFPCWRSPQLRRALAPYFSS